MAEAEQSTTPIPVLTEAPVGGACFRFSEEERATIRASLLGIARQRGVKLSEADLQNRAANALLAHEKFAELVASRRARKAHTIPSVKRREALADLEAHMRDVFHPDIPGVVQAALELVAIHIEALDVWIEANRHGRNSFRSTACRHIMDVWGRAGGNLSASSTEEQGSYGPLIEHLELMLSLFEVPVPRRHTLRKYVNEERWGRERMLEWLRLHPGSRAGDNCPL